MTAARQHFHLSVLIILLFGGLILSSMFAVPILAAQSATATPLPGTGSIAGAAWEDINGNGVREANEVGLQGMLITARSTQVTASGLTGADGAYRLAGLQPGLYHVTATPPVGYELTTQAAFDVLVGDGVVLTLDFGAKFVPTPTPSPTPLPYLDTDGAQRAYCGGVYQGDTRTAANHVSRYPCQPAWDESGPEAVYWIESPRSQPLSVTLLHADVDLDLFLLQYARADSCIAAGDRTLSADLSAGVYLLAVDGYQGAAGQFTFRLNCPEGLQATPTLTLTPTPTFTPTATFTPGPTPTATATPRWRAVFLPLILRSMP